MGALTGLCVCDIFLMMAATVPSVRVAIPYELRSLCDGKAELQLSGQDVREVLAELARQHPQVHVRLCDERGEPRPHINVFVNDQFCPRGELGVALSAGDLVSILPAVSGG